VKIIKSLLVAVLFSFGVFMVQPTTAAETLNYSHGTYVGDTLNGKAHGFGTYTSKQSGTKYTGQFVADTFSGAGTMVWINGSKFVGEWKNDAGVNGTITYANGTTAVGTVRNALFYAAAQQPQAGSQSTSTNAQNKLPPCQGDRSNWNMCLGTYRDVDVNYIGEWNGGLWHGKGTVTLTSGARYVGEFQSGKYHGQGEFVGDGDRYVGEWKNGVRDGQGTETFGEAEKYVGQFKNNTQNGQGTVNWPNGAKFSGQWQNGEGVSGTITYANGTSEAATVKVRDYHYVAFTAKNPLGSQQQQAQNRVANAAPFQAKTGYEWMWKRNVPVLYIQSTENNVVIINVMLNRGNCRVSMLNYSVFPVRLAYGETIKVMLENACPNLLEAAITTNLDTFTLKWNQ
jgi:hypothetical protein